jgi:hypothetical protein
MSRKYPSTGGAHSRFGTFPNPLQHGVAISLHDGSGTQRVRRGLLSQSSAQTTGGQTSARPNKELLLTEEVDRSQAELLEARRLEVLVRGWWYGGRRVSAAATVRLRQENSGVVALPPPICLPP